MTKAETSNSSYISFKVTKRNAGFLGLGAEVSKQKVTLGQTESGFIDEVKRETLQKAVVYGDGLHAVYRHSAARISGDPEKIAETEAKLPRLFRAT